MPEKPISEMLRSQHVSRQRPQDVTLPVCAQALKPWAAFIPISQVWDELTEIFADMGFSVAEGPDIESEEKEF